MRNEKIVLWAVLFVGGGFVTTVAGLLALVLVLHDGAATQAVVGALQNVMWASFVALTGIFAVHTISNNNNTPTGGTPNA